MCSLVPSTVSSVGEMVSSRSVLICVLKGSSVPDDGGVDGNTNLCFSLLDPEADVGCILAPCVESKILCFFFARLMVNFRMDETGNLLILLCLTSVFLFRASFDAGKTFPSSTLIIMSSLDEFGSLTDGGWTGNLYLLERSCVGACSGAGLVDPGTSLTDSLSSATEIGVQYLLSKSIRNAPKNSAKQEQSLQKKTTGNILEIRS